jgi:hypothetical protein
MNRSLKIFAILAVLLPCVTFGSTHTYTEVTNQQLETGVVTALKHTHRGQHVKNLVTITLVEKIVNVNCRSLYRSVKVGSVLDVTIGKKFRVTSHNGTIVNRLFLHDVVVRVKKY